MMSPRLLFVHALSPLHAGTGQSIGAIDLAIARDRATQFPYLPGSSLKGSLRDAAVEKFQDVAVVKKLFGPGVQDNPSEHAGALIVSDANLLLLPVRSVSGTFAWVTSPYLLHRFRRDVEAAGLGSKLLFPPDKVLPAKLTDCVVGNDSSLVARVKSLSSGKDEDKVIFEDLDLSPARQAALNEFARGLGNLMFADESFWQDSLAKRICIVHDDIMTFLSEHATDVVARIALQDETKTVKGGALWYEESLPTESILVALVQAQKITSKLNAPALSVEQCLAHVANLASSIQLGGKATVGRGRCRLVMQGARP